MVIYSKPHKLLESDYHKMIEQNKGYCRICKDFTTELVEHDAEYYQCDKCDEKTVFGVAVASMLGMIELYGA